jgi:hypothetical protein
VVTLANEYIGYVCTPQAFMSGGYEPRTQMTAQRQRPSLRYLATLLHCSPGSNPGKPLSLPGRHAFA